MGRRLAEATKACRTRRTCGEIFLRFFLVLVEAAVFFLADVALAGVLLAGVLLAGVLLTDGDELDWAAAGCDKLSQSRKKVPAKTTTAKRRTQTLPTAGSWHP
jgi:hypothetical protein